MLGLGGVAVLRVSSHALTGVHSSLAGYRGPFERSLLVKVLFIILSVEELTHKERVPTLIVKFDVPPRPVRCVQQAVFVGCGSFGALARRALLPPGSAALHLLVDHEGGVLEDLHILLAAVGIVIVQH